MQTIRKSLGLVLIMFVLCGFIFPLTVTALGQVLFPEQANGSLVKQDGKVIGSKLIGQQWTEPKYFHGRIKQEGQKLSSDAVTASGSGLDPDITVDNAKQQVKRIAKERNIDASKINHLIDENKQASPMADDYVNVLKLNITLDKL